MTQRQNGGSSGSAGYRSVNLSEEERDSFCRGVPAIKPSHSPTNRLSGLTISFDNPHPETNHQVPTPYSGNRTPHFQEPFGSSKASSTVAPGKRFAPPACCSYRSRMLIRPPASFSHRSDPQRGPGRFTTRRRAQTWCSLFVAPYAPEGTPPVFNRCGLGRTTFLSILQRYSRLVLTVSESTAKPEYYELSIACSDLRT